MRVTIEDDGETRTLDAEAFVVVAVKRTQEQGAAFEAHAITSKSFVEVAGEVDKKEHEFFQRHHHAPPNSKLLDAVMVGFLELARFVAEKVPHTTAGKRLGVLYRLGRTTAESTWRGQAAIRERERNGA